MIYKNHNITFDRQKHETQQEYQLRVWFVAKNIHMTINMDELIGYSHIHVKIFKYNYKFSDEIMKRYMELQHNLFT